MEFTFFGPRLSNEFVAEGLRRLMIIRRDPRPRPRPALPGRSAGLTSRAVRPQIPAGEDAVSKEKSREDKVEKSLAVISEGASMDGVLQSTAVIHLCAHSTAASSPRTS